MKTPTKYLLMLLTILIASLSANAAIFTVNSNLDTDNGLGDNNPAGSNTLRKCIRLANLAPGSTINFGLANAINTITITNINALKITQSTTINGFSNTGALANTTAFGGTLNPTYRIKITSNHAAGFDTCIHVTASNCVIKGLVFQDFGSDNDDNDDATIKDIAILLTGNGNTVEGCFIGCNETSAYLSGSFYQSVGILVTGNNNTIGGTTVAGKNLISGNTYAGVIISGSAATGNKVVGNYIGAFQKDGKSPIIDNMYIAYNPAGLIHLADSVQGRQQYGVRIVANASANKIGDTTSASYDGRNCISMNIHVGVAISGGASNNSVKSNIIGLAPDGITQLNRGEPNVPLTMTRHSEQAVGIQLGEEFSKFNGAAIGNTIGGSTANQRNYIAGNQNSDAFPYFSASGKEGGVYFAHAGTINNTVRGNYIGTNSAGTAEPNTSPDGYLYEQTYGISTSLLAKGGNSIIGNLISGNSHGINLFCGGFTIRGNTIGAQANGTSGIAPLNGNQINGIVLENTCTQKCIIGGTAAGQRNLISGNSSRGIFINHTGAAAHRIIGNYIGTNVNGTAALIMAAANQTTGIDFGSLANTTSGDSILSNVISYNNSRGIRFRVVSGTSYIFGNTIGLQANGTTAGAAQISGVEFEGAVNNIQIGGSVAGQGNIISGNTTNGILLNATGAATNIRILGNIIGSTSALANPTGNSQDYGIAAAAGSSFSGSKIGGTVNGEGNTITLNTVGGILLNNVNNNIFISRNLIYSNPAGAASSSINLNALANGNRVAPVITTANLTTISGTCTSGDVVQVFKNNSGGVNCQDMNVFLGTATTTGTTWTLTVASAAGDKVVATGSNSASTMTSGVSACATVVGGGAGLNLNLTALIEGYYNATTNTMVSDVITVELHNSTTPFALVTSKSGVTLSTAGIATVNFPAGSSGVNYFIVFKHRNSLETWSATAVPFVAGSLAYDFTTAATKAFGSNMIKKGTRWCMFSGDIDQNGSIDGNDMTPIDNDSFVWLTGFVVSDLNGDLSVDGNDMTFVDNNSGNWIQVIKP